jgi:copper chaperone CopZ
MKSLVLEVPRMFGDHHVLEVRRILLALPGVDSVNASSAFRAVEVSFDEEKTPEGELTKALDDGGYLGELDVPLETGEVTAETEGERYFRHTEALETVADVISFGQVVAPPTGPMLRCPGMTALRMTDD